MSSESTVKCFPIFFGRGGVVINCTSYLSFFSVILMHVKGSGKNSQTPIFFCNDLPLIFFPLPSFCNYYCTFCKTLTVESSPFQLHVGICLVRLDPWSAHVAKNMGGSRANTNKISMFVEMWFFFNQSKLLDQFDLFDSVIWILNNFWKCTCFGFLFTDYMYIHRHVTVYVTISDLLSKRRKLSISKRIFL